MHGSSAQMGADPTVQQPRAPRVCTEFLLCTSFITNGPRNNTSAKEQQPLKINQARSLKASIGTHSMFLVDVTSKSVTERRKGGSRCSSTNNSGKPKRHT